MTVRGTGLRRAAKAEARRLATSFCREGRPLLAPPPAGRSVPLRHSPHSTGICSYKKDVISRAIGVMAVSLPPSASRRPQQYPSSAPVSPPNTSKYWQRPCVPCTSRGRRSDGRLSHAALRIAVTTLLRRYDRRSWIRHGRVEQRSLLRAAPSDGMCIVPFQRQSLDCLLRGTYDHPSQPVCALIEVGLKLCCRCRMRNHKSAFPKLCLLDQQNAVGRQVIEPQVDSF